MEEIITVNGNQYRVDLNSPLTIEQRNEVINKLENEIIKNLATGCGQTIKTGTSKNITATASAGNGNYKYELMVNGTVTQTYPTTGYTTETSHIFSQTFSTVGTQNISLKVTDSCAGSTASCIDPATGTCTVIVQNAFVDIVTLTGCTSAINVGTTCTLSAACTDQFSGTIACGTMIWTTSASAVATVTNGVVTGVSTGTATITATSANGKYGSKVVTVSCTTPSCGFTIST